jgi:hypothetical protein
MLKMFSNNPVMNIPNKRFGCCCCLIIQSSSTWRGIEHNEDDQTDHLNCNTSDGFFVAIIGTLHLQAYQF